MNPNLLNWLTFGGIIVGTIILGFLVNRFFLRLIRKGAEDEDIDLTNYKFLRRAAVSIIYIIGVGIAIYSLPTLRTLAKSMLAGAGIMAVAIGFASQQALANIISGVFIVLFKPFRVGDRVKIQTMNGIVEDITLRHTVIKDYENKRIIIPNSIISNEFVVNSDIGDEKICKLIDFGISFESNIEKAKSIIMEESMNHPLRIDARSPEQIEEGALEVPVRVIQLLDSAILLRAWVWSKDSPDGFQMQCDLIEQIVNRFNQEGIEIPYPHRTLVNKSSQPNIHLI